MHKTAFIFLLIGLLFASNLNTQNLTLKINSNSKVEAHILDSIGYKIKYSNYKALEAEINSLKSKLFNLGYIENEIKFIKKINDTTFTSNLNLRNKYKTLHIYYNPKDINLSVIKRVSNNIFNEYFTIPFPDVRNAMQTITNEMTKKGFPFAKVQLTDIEIKNSNNLKASLTIRTSKKTRTIDLITIKGYKKFPKTFLKHFLKIKQKQLFNLETIKKKTRNLQNLSFANEIKPPEVLFSKDSTSLYLYLKKQQSNTFDGFLGFGTNDLTNKLEFDGYLNLNLTNNLNLGESFKLLYKSDENNQNTFEVNVTLPYLFKTPIGADVLLRLFRRDTSFATTNQSLRLNYQINTKHKIYSGLITTESTNLQNTNTAALISDYKTKHYTIAYEFLKQEGTNLLFPVQSQLYLESAFGNRETALATEKQSQFNFSASHIFNLNIRNSLYIKANGSNLISNQYFENELLRFGGINSIRGFEENSISASLFGVINTEYRYRLNESIYIHSIFDAAYFENKTINSKKKLYGYGFGVGIITNSGLLKFNYANGKDEDTSFKLSNSKIHVSLTVSF